MKIDASQRRRSLRDPRHVSGQPLLPFAAMTRTQGPRRFRLSALALLPLVGLATFLGTSVVSQAAGGDPVPPVNLVTNGDFGATTAPTNSYSTVLAGDPTTAAATIPGWTVVTPSIYAPLVGSVDLVSADYNNWGAQGDSSYSIDLGGTSGAAGGIYQNVPTTPGLEYLLKFFTAVNGDQVQGQSHLMGVVVGDTSLPQIQALSAGTGNPLQWVPQTYQFTATSSSTHIEFDDATPGDTNQGPALDNVSLTLVPDTITATAATVAAKTTGKPFTVQMATFTDSYLTLPGDFSATIDWGDGTPVDTTPTIALQGTKFTVTGTHTYPAHGTYSPVTVTITSIAGTTASVLDSVSVADAVTTCTGSGCSGSVMTPQQNVGISSSSTAGTIQTDVDPANNAYSCGDPFRHAPLITTVTDTGLNANIIYTVTFANKAAAGSWIVPFAVCYQSQTAFRDLYGNTVTTGLLPLCTLLPRPGKPVVAPCVESITELPLYLGNVVEKVVLPAGDPRFH
jgi:Protein of unknown function (DUF642)